MRPTRSDRIPTPRQAARLQDLLRREPAATQVGWSADGPVVQIRRQRYRINRAGQLVPLRWREEALALARRSAT